MSLVGPRCPLAPQLGPSPCHPITWSPVPLLLQPLKPHASTTSARTARSPGSCARAPSATRWSAPQHRAPVSARGHCPWPPPRPHPRASGRAIRLERRLGGERGWPGRGGPVSVKGAFGTEGRGLAGVGVCRVAEGGSDESPCLPSPTILSVWRLQALPSSQIGCQGLRVPPGPFLCFPNLLK